MPPPPPVFFFSFSTTVITTTTLHIEGLSRRCFERCTPEVVGYKYCTYRAVGLRCMIYSRQISVSFFKNKIDVDWAG